MRYEAQVNMLEGLFEYYLALIEHRPGESAPAMAFSNMSQAPEPHASALCKVTDYIAG